MRYKIHTYLLCILLLCMHSLAWAINIKDIRIGVKKTYTRVVFDLNDKPNIYNIKYMSSPERIVLDFTEGSISQYAIKSTAAYPLINKINGTNIRNNGFSVELELQQEANFKHFVLPPTKNSGYRLVLDITPGKHNFPLAPQTIIPEENIRLDDNVTNYKSDAIKLYDNKVMNDLVLEQLFQPILGNTRLRQPYYQEPPAQIKTAPKDNIKNESAPRFDIRGYKIKGNTLLELDELRSSIKPFTGKDKSFTDVQHALESLERSYQKLGFGMVQVYLPEQELDKGVILFQVVEPKVNTLTVQGANFYSLKNIQQSIVSLKKGDTPNTKEIAENLSLINENPAKKTTVQFIASDEEGKLNAIINVQDKEPSAFSFTFDNTGTESTGLYRLGVGYQNANFTGNDDVLNFQYTTSDKSNALSAYSLGYHLPFYNRNASFDIFGGYSQVDSGIIQNLYKVSGKGIIMGMRYNQVLSKRNNYTHRLNYGLDYRKYDTDAIQLSGGDSLVPDIEVHPISLTYSGQWVSPGSATGFNIQFHHNAFTKSQDAVEFSNSRTGAKANYSVFRYGVEHAQSFAKTWQMRLALTGQQTKDALISGEQFGIGGATSVRGYSEREVSNDKGVQATAEIYTSNFSSSIGLSGDIRGLIFYDIAQVTRNQSQAGDISSASLSSIGTGIRFNYKDILTFKLDVASTLKDSTIQKKGDIKIHTGLKYVF